MPINYLALGKRIAFFRNKSHLTQDDLADRLNMSRTFLARIETSSRHPSLETIVELANALGVSTDDLLVDSLKCSASTADSELHRLLLDCNPVEEEILTRMVKELKAILYGLGI